MASFIPPIRSVPSSLSRGKYTIRVVVDQNSVKAAAKGIDSTIAASAKGLALYLSNEGVNFMRKADLGAGRAYLASKWTNTQPDVRGDGSVAVEVFNAAETELIYSKSNAPGSNSRYPISGKRLLNILLNGARAHPISAREESNPLAFSMVRGQRQSRFAGMLQHSGGFAIASFQNRGRLNAIFFGQAVNHPGVVPSRFLQGAKMYIERLVSTQGEAVVNRVVASVAPGKIGTTF